MIIAIVALVSGKQILMEFHLFQCLLYQVGGRGGETATRLYSHLCTKVFISDGIESLVLGIEVKRDKNHVEDFHRIFPQADVKKWWDDFTFILALTVIQKCQDHHPPSVAKNANDYRDRLFDNFFEHSVGNVPEGSKKNRSVSKQWKVVFDTVLDEIHSSNISTVKTDGISGSDVMVQLNASLGSHNAKRRTAQHLTDTHNNPISTIQRIGWSSESVHTMFDYITRSIDLDIGAGKKLAGWHDVVGTSSNSGGHPPIPSMATERDCVHKTAEDELIGKLKESLFAGCQLSSEITNLMLGAIFKHWQSFVKSILDTNANNVYTALMTTKLMECEITNVQFERWCKTTELVFQMKNIQGLPMSFVKELPGETVVDLRTMRDFMSTMIKQNHTIATDHNVLQSQFHSFQLENNSLKEKMQLLTNTITAIIPVLNLITNGNLINIGAVKEPVVVKAVIPKVDFEEWQLNQRKKKSLPLYYEKLFLAWHYDGVEDGYVISPNRNRQKLFVSYKKLFTIMIKILKQDGGDLLTYYDFPRDKSRKLKDKWWENTLAMLAGIVKNRFPNNKSKGMKQKDILDFYRTSPRKTKKRKADVVK